VNGAKPTLILLCAGSAALAQGTSLAAPAPLAIDAAQSAITIHVHRAGALSAFGHNHVIESRAVSGSVWLGDPREQSRFELEFPVGSLVVDDPAARKAAGPDFTSVPSDKDREGTRTNMLGPAQLDAARSPLIRVRSTSIRGAGPRYDVTAEVTIRGRGSELRFPVEVTEGGASGLRVTGELSVRQSDLGLTPFRALGGALKVKDELRIAFDVAAHPGAAASGVDARQN
jgi:polyisoprenoid-binding protein YceI